jgi:transcription elongation GreA/GreB family factor
LIDKQELINKILEKLNQELSAITLSAIAAHEAATHEESRSEDKHDTRGLEASYLAGAQAKRIADLKRLLSFYKFLPIQLFGPGDPIAPGALIELELNGKRSFYFLVSQEGGISISIQGKIIQSLATLAPLGDALIGKKIGDMIEIERENLTREYEIISLY